MSQIQQPGLRGVDQTVAVLRAFSGKLRGAGVREIARELDMSKSTLQRIAASLAEARFLVYDEHTERYSLGPAILELAADYNRATNLSLAANEPLASLWRQTEETACLVMKVDRSRVCVLQFESPHSLRFTGELGRPVPLTVGASSRVLLSLLPDRELDWLLSSLGLSASEQAEMREEIAIARTQGWAVSRGEVTPGGTAISAPVGIHQGSPLVVGLYAPDSRMPSSRIDEVLPLLQEAAAAIAVGLTGRAYSQ